MLELYSEVKCYVCQFLDTMQSEEMPHLSEEKIKMKQYVADAFADKVFAG